MIRKAIRQILIYFFASVVGGLTGALLSIPFLADSHSTILRYSVFLGLVTFLYSILIIPVIAAFNTLVWRFLPNLYLLKCYPVFAYIIFGVNHFLAGFTFFSSSYWPIQVGRMDLEHGFVLAIAAALSGSTAIYVNIGAEKIKQYYQRNST